jgi:hypothetical protein
MDDGADVADLPGGALEVLQAPDAAAFVTPSGSHPLDTAVPGRRADHMTNLTPTAHTCVRQMISTGVEGRGAVHVACPVGEACVDAAHRVASITAYIHSAPDVSEVGRGIAELVDRVLGMFARLARLRDRRSGTAVGRHLLIGAGPGRGCGQLSGGTHPGRKRNTSDFWHPERRPVFATGRVLPVRAKQVIKEAADDDRAAPTATFRRPDVAIRDVVCALWTLAIDRRYAARPRIHIRLVQ